jgi:predicted HNH restriction endonuclease
MSANVDDTPLHKMVNLALATPEQLEARARARALKQIEYTRKQRAKSARWWARTQRDVAIEMLGSVCVGCGYSDKRALHIDHIEPLAITGRKRANASPEAIRCNGVGFQLLCANCHAIKTYDDRKLIRKHKDIRELDDRLPM